MVEQKYGKSQPQSLFEALDELRKINQGERSIFLKINGVVDVMLDIHYFDESIRQLAEAERLTVQSADIDASGL